MTGAPAAGAEIPTHDAFEVILAHVEETRGFDFTGYKRSSLSRRVARRMEQIGIADHAEYLDRLELDADEYTTLSNTILINVTAFFRDHEAWDYLRTEVLPTLVAAAPPGRSLRVWSAGCASGAEAYTLAMVLRELLGAEDFRHRVKIYATDVDIDGLATARQAAYGEREVDAVPADDLVQGEMVGLDELRHETLLTSPLAQVVVTADGTVAMINRRAAMMFGASARDIGRPFRDLDLSYRPVELRQVIEQAQFDRRPMRITDIRAVHGTDPGMHLDIEVTPIVASDSRLLGVSVVFDDVSQAHRLQEELEQANRQLENAYEELQSANEQLETTNEELQSTVEELETTNEELRSTNEQLETVNEELRSTDDELQVINEQLQARSGELDTANEFLESILTSLRAAVVVLGGDLTVQVWNRQAQELWGLRREETVGEYFLNLDIGLPLDQLRPMIRRTLAGELGPHEIAVPAVNRRGRAISVRIFGTPLRSSPDEAGGVILLMDHDEPALETNGQAHSNGSG